MIKEMKKELAPGLAPITCGAYVVDAERNLLICHPTDMLNTIWSIPKGIQGDAEDGYTAAVRELEEETGIKIDDYKYKMYDMGLIPYEKKHKILHGFFFILDTVIHKELVCASTFHHKKLDVFLPEVDIIKWEPFHEAMKIIQPEQQKLFKRFGMG